MRHFLILPSTFIIVVIVAFIPRCHGSDDATFGKILNKESFTLRKNHAKITTVGAHITVTPRSSYFQKCSPTTKNETCDEKDYEILITQFDRPVSLRSVAFRLISSKKGPPRDGVMKWEIMVADSGCEEMKTYGIGKSLVNKSKDIQSLEPDEFCSTKIDLSNLAASADDSTSTPDVYRCHAIKIFDRTLFANITHVALQQKGNFGYIRRWRAGVERQRRFYIFTVKHLAERQVHALFLLTTSNFFPRLDVLI